MFGPDIINFIDYGASVPYNDSFLMIEETAIYFYNTEKELFEVLEQTLQHNRECALSGVMVEKNVFNCS